MPSFDAVSEVDNHELTNAVDQANREVANRYDFKGSDAKFEHNDDNIVMHAQSEFQLNQMQDILLLKMTKRGIDIKALDMGEPETSGNRAKQTLKVKQGIDQDTARKIVKLIKDQKLKVQAAIRGDKVRVTGKKRDDLQEVIALLREKDLGLPLQFNNFRD